MTLRNINSYLARKENICKQGPWSRNRSIGRHDYIFILPILITCCLTKIRDKFFLKLLLNDMKRMFQIKRGPQK